MMIDNRRKVREIYDCKYITSDEELYPLQKWYNQLIDKTIDKINVADVLRMLRQKVFLKLAMLKTIEFLKNNIFIGELYDGELLEKISESDIPLLVPYSNDLKIILKNAIEKGMLHEWSYDGEEKEFKKLVETVLVKIM